MKLLALISKIDATKPNSFTLAEKIGWVNEVEGLVQTEILLLDPTQFVIYPSVLPVGYDPELLAKFPYDKIYWAYLCAMVDFCNGEYNRYNNSINLFNTWFGEYSKWFADRYRPADGRMIVRGYYLTAYGLALAHGYHGTEEQWIASLKGAKGDPGASPYIGENGNWYTWDGTQYVDTGTDATGYELSQDDADARYLLLSGGTMTGDIDMNANSLKFGVVQMLKGIGNKLSLAGAQGANVTIENVAAPTNNNEAANKAYVDGKMLTVTASYDGTLYDMSEDYDGILAAHEAGKLVRMHIGTDTDAEIELVLSGYTETGDALVFSGDNSSGYEAGDKVRVTVNSLDQWDIRFINLANDGVLTIKQGGVTKGTFSANQYGNTTVNLDAGSGGGAYIVTMTYEDDVYTLDKSYAEILAAINAQPPVELHISINGQLVILKTITTVSGMIIFTGLTGDGASAAVSVNSADNVNFLMTGALADQTYVDDAVSAAKDSLVVTVTGSTSDTSSADIYDAHTEGKDIRAVYNGRVYRYVSGTSSNAMFTASWTDASYNIHAGVLSITGTFAYGVSADMVSFAKLEELDLPDKTYVDDAIAAAIGDAIGGAY